MGMKLGSESAGQNIRRMLRTKRSGECLGIGARKQQEAGETTIMQNFVKLYSSSDNV
jgi:hypothetical protein